MSALTLTPAERTALLESAKDDLVERIYNECRDDLQIVSKARAAGLLDVDGNTLDKIGLPRIVLGNGGKLVKYSMADISAFIAARREK